MSRLALVALGVTVACACGAPAKPASSGSESATGTAAPASQPGPLHFASLLVWRITNPRERDVAIAQIAEGHIAKGEIGVAHALLSRLPASETRALLLADLAIFHWANDDEPRAEEMLAEARAVAKEADARVRQAWSGPGPPPSPPPPPSVDTEGIPARLAEKLAEAGRLDAALDWARQTRWRRTSLLLDLARLFERDGDSKQAAQLLQEAEREVAYNFRSNETIDVAEALLEAGQASRALALIDGVASQAAVDALEERVWRISDPGRCALARSAEVYLAAGKTDLAIGAMDDGGERCPWDLLWTLGGRGDVASIRRFLDHSDKLATDASARAALALALAVSGDADGDARELEAAVRLRGSSNPRYTVSMLTKAAVKYREAGLVDRAVEIARQALPIAREVKEGERELPLREVAEELASAGRCGEAAVVTRSQALASYTLARIAELCQAPEEYPAIVAELPRIDVNDRKSQLLAALAPKYAESGTPAEALRLAAEIPLLRYRVEALVRIDPAYPETDDAELAALLRRVAEAPFAE